MIALSIIVGIIIGWISIEIITALSPREVAFPYQFNVGMAIAGAIIGYIIAIKFLI